MPIDKIASSCNDDSRLCLSLCHLGSRAGDQCCIICCQSCHSSCLYHDSLLFCQQRQLQLVSQQSPCCLWCLLERSTEFRLGCSMDCSTEVNLDRLTETKVAAAATMTRQQRLRRISILALFVRLTCSSVRRRQRQR